MLIDHKSHFLRMGIFAQLQLPFKINDFQVEAIVMSSHLALSSFGCLQLDQKFVCTLLEIPKTRQAGS